MKEGKKPYCPNCNHELEWPKEHQWGDPPKCPNCHRYIPPQNQNRNWYS